MKPQFSLMFSLAFGVCTFTVLGHHVPVHRAITVHAAASAFSDSPAYAGFIEMISADLPLKDATNSMVEGSAREDALFEDAGGARSLNHFYDPLTVTGSVPNGA